MIGLVPRLDTRDLDSAREQVARSYCPHSLAPSGRGFHARQAEAGGPDLGVSTLSYGSGAVRVRPVPFGDFVLVSRVTAGVLTVGTGPRRTVVPPGAAIALDPDGDHQLDVGPGCALVTVRLSAGLLARAATGPGHPTLATGGPVDPGPWDAVTRFLVREAVPQRLLDSPLSAPVAQLAAAAAWASFAPHRPPPGRPGHAVHRALAYIDEHAHEDIGLLDIAAAAGAAPRTLQEHFRIRVGCSPTEHLRAVRLRRVHEDLLARRGATVAEIAWRWGFGNLGRFATAYRRAYGRLPSTDFRD